VKVIFIEDVPDVALAGETREVADGYGRNYLLPKKLAVLANSAASNIVEAQMKKVIVKRAQAEAEMSEVAGKLNGMEFTIQAKVGEKERLYGSVTSADIATEIASRSGMEIDKRKIEIEEPIREVGNYDVTVRFTHDISAAIKLTVISDKAPEEKEEPEEKAEEKKRKPKARKKEEEPEEAGEEVKEETVEPEDTIEETTENTEEKAGETESGE